MSKGIFGDIITNVCLLSLIKFKFRGTSAKSLKSSAIPISQFSCHSLTKRECFLPFIVTM